LRRLVFKRGRLAFVDTRVDEGFLVYNDGGTMKVAKCVVERSVEDQVLGDLIYRCSITASFKLEMRKDVRRGFQAESEV